ncbi:MAG: YfdX family protein [Kiritimatiellales bacterium]|nr:YfdX family protein [Kiritimatiellota bacterium]MBL7016840.1 YfdX family protein [Kiritimatiellales bacterium]
MKKLLTAWMIVLCLLALPSVQISAQEDPAKQPGESEHTQTVAPEAEDQSAQTQSVQTEVEAKAEDQVAEKRKEILTEAMGAVAETRTALKALEDKKAEEALASLEDVMGKLDLIIARDPELALAPVSVSVMTHDLYASPDTVKQQVKTAKEFLDEGAVQAARALLSVMASEIRIRTTQIPLASYPDAIKAIAPLIDEGKTEEAKTQLQIALNTLVVTEEVIPLPVLRAQSLLLAAEKLAGIDQRTADQNSSLADMLTETRNQIKLAQELGYGEKKMFEPIYDQISQIEKKTQTGKSGTGFFNEIKKKLSGF